MLDSGEEMVHVEYGESDGHCMSLTVHRWMTFCNLLPLSQVLLSAVSSSDNVPGSSCFTTY